MVIIDGKAVATKIRNQLKNEVASLGAEIGLAVVLVGDDNASRIYVRNKINACGEIGLKSTLVELPSSATESEIIDAVNEEVLKCFTEEEIAALKNALRIIADGKIAVYNRLGGGVLMATLPSSKNDMVYDLLKPVHECVEKAKNIFQTCLQNANPMLHPCITTLNAARIEGPNDFFFYEEGVTPGVGRLLKAIDDFKTWFKV